MKCLGPMRTDVWLNGASVAVELLPRVPYEAKYVAACGSIGFAFESQSGTHALGSDRRVPFRARPNSLAYVPAGCDVYSQSTAGGEYLIIRIPGWTPAKQRQFNDAVASEAIMSAQAIRRELLAGPGAGAGIEGSIGVLMATVARFCSSERQRTHCSRSMTNQRLRQIDELIEERMQERLTVHDLAETLGLSVGFLIRAFRTEVGMTPHDYIMDRRLARARSLLTKSDMRIATVAAACGFANQAHLATVFRRYLDVSPSTFSNRANSRG